MKILAINNYSLDEALADAARGIYPRHHCWGVDYLLAEGHEVETMLFKPPRGASLLRKVLYAIVFNLRLMRKLRGFDAVIAFANPVIALLAFWRKWGGDTMSGSTRWFIITNARLCCRRATIRYSFFLNRLWIVRRRLSLPCAIGLNSFLGAATCLFMRPILKQCLVTWTGSIRFLPTERRHETLLWWLKLVPRWAYPLSSLPIR